MSGSFWWGFCLINERQYHELSLKFNQASAQEETVSEKYEKAYALCAAEPASILPRFISYGDLPKDKRSNPIYKNGYIECQLSDDFSLATYRPALGKLFHDLPFDDERAAKLIILKGLTPVSILYYALSPGVAEQLPGFSGNMIIHKSRIAETITKVECVLKNLDDQAWDRARRLINVCTAGEPSFTDDQEIEDIFYAVPNSLKYAQEKKMSIAGICSREF